MIVYADREEWVDAAPELERLRASASSLAAAGSPPHGDVAELLIDFGRLEAGVVDALSPSEDDAPPLARAFREASLALGRALRATWRRDSDDDLPRALSSVTDAFRLLTADGLPERVRLTVPEGYAFYALYPEMYLAAAERFAAEARPEWAVCIGIRSIGTSLSAVVAAALEAAGCRVASYTLRPRGHPFDRRPALADALAAELRGQSDAWFLVVDEGPGLSGSSFCGTAEALSALGVPDERIVLFPSWVPDGGGFRSPAARERWGRHRKVAASFEEVWLQSGRLFAGVPHHEVRDWSAGAWRADLIGDETCFPAVQPQHERRKYLLSGGGDATLLKFASLGARGRKALDRARALAEAGFAPPALGVEDGFLRTRFVPGRPHLSGPAEPDLAETAARYLAFRARRFRTGHPAPVSALAEMVRVNVREGLGEEWADRLGFLESLPPEVADAEAVEVDGRMLPHEWVRTAGGWLKTDGVDHHDDHFFPGCQDPAWDVASFAVETGMEDSAASAFAARCAELGGDDGFAARLPVYRVAYPAYRLGYATMAAESLGDSADGARMAALAQRYAAVLRREIARCAR